MTDQMRILLAVILALPGAVCGQPVGENEPEDLAAREARTPEEVALALSEHYGRAMEKMSYIPALALWARLWLGEIREDPQVREEVLKIAAGAPQAARRSGPALAGNLIFAALGDVEKVRQSVLVEVGADGVPRPVLEDRVTMSDSVFMRCPLLVEAGALTGDARYFAAAATHLFAIEDQLLREDGLYRHSPKSEVAWGRGNGFPALGLALSLTELPPEHPDYRDVAASFREHLTALASHQDEEGMWHQVIDRPDSYAEFSATCMIGFAMLRGKRLGVLEEERFEPAADRAWTAIKRRIAMNGESLEKVCVSTGALATMEDYLNRRANSGRDERGGAMALLFAVERLAWERGGE